MLHVHPSESFPDGAVSCPNRFESMPPKKIAPKQATAAMTGHAKGRKGSDKEHETALLPEMGPVGARANATDKSVRKQHEIRPEEDAASGSDASGTEGMDDIQKKKATEKWTGYLQNARAEYPIWKKQAQNKFESITKAFNLDPDWSLGENIAQKVQNGGKWKMDENLQAMWVHLNTIRNRAATQCATEQDAGKPADKGDGHAAEEHVDDEDSDAHAPDEPSRAASNSSPNGSSESSAAVDTHSESGEESDVEPKKRRKTNQRKEPRVASDRQAGKPSQKPRKKGSSRLSPEGLLGVPKSRADVDGVLSRTICM